ncbi:MAG: LacI family DNA-binding transcriptional regulator, partial [Propionibacteriaceae bacterium]|nr:LacI family DNA-binding transcriptional regulator [Propionibacteriaceae bacterium]
MNRRVTIVDVARAAGVSTSTASVALRGEKGVSEATRERIVAQAAAMGYRVDDRARLLREHRSRAVGVTFRPDQAFHTGILAALYDAAAARGVDLVLSAVTPNRDTDAAVEALLRDRCSALLLVSPEIEPGSVERWARTVPVVTLGSPLRVAGVDSVLTDEGAGLDLAVGHLADLGHRHIVHLDGGSGVMAQARAEGFHTAMTARGLTPRVLPGGLTEEAGIAAAEALFPTSVPEPAGVDADAEAGRIATPTAVVTYNDMAAIGLLLTLRARAVAVPDEVSIVGYDDTSAAALSTIGLTTVSQDPAALAGAALE